MNAHLFYVQSKTEFCVTMGLHHVLLNMNHEKTDVWVFLFALFSWVWWDDQGRAHRSHPVSRLPSALWAQSALRVDHRGSTWKHHWVCITHSTCRFYPPCHYLIYSLWHHYQLFMVPTSHLLSDLEFQTINSLTIAAGIFWHRSRLSERVTSGLPDILRFMHKLKPWLAFTMVDISLCVCASIVLGCYLSHQGWGGVSRALAFWQSYTLASPLPL